MGRGFDARMNQGRYSYDATVHHGGIVDGALACPECGGVNLPPTRESTRVDLGLEYGPTVAVVADCEGGHTVEILRGNDKGDLGMSVRQRAAVEAPSAPASAAGTAASSDAADGLGDRGRSPFRNYRVTQTRTVVVDDDDVTDAVDRAKDSQYWDVREVHAERVVESTTEWTAKEPACLVAATGFSEGRGGGRCARRLDGGVRGGHSAKRADAGRRQVPGPDASAAARSAGRRAFAVRGQRFARLEDLASQDVPEGRPTARRNDLFDDDGPPRGG
jgi:hypothetical protein